MQNEENTSSNDNITLPENIDAKPIEADEISFAPDSDESLNKDDAADGKEFDGAAEDESENASDAEDNESASDAEDNESENASDAEDNPDYLDDDYEDDFIPDDDYEETENAAESGSEGGGDFENPKSKKIHLSEKTVKIIVSAAAGVVAVAAAVFIWAAASLPTNTIMRNTYIEDIAVGGKTFDEASELIKDKMLLENQEITLSCNDKTFTINGNDIGITPNLENTAKIAFNYGKDKNFAVNALKNIKSLFVKKTFIPVAFIDAGLLDQKINEFGIELYGEMVGHYIEINETDTTATIWPGHTGYDPNSEASYKDAEAVITENLNNSNYYNISVDLQPSAPPDLTIDAFDAAVYADPTDAYYTVEDNTVNIVPEQTGRYINRDEAAPLLANVHEGGEVVKIPYYISYADITAEQLGNKLFNATLASYSTNYGGSTANRKANVARAAENMNGYILAPGEIFSFNDVVGDRTTANGFYSATEYVEGKAVEGIGGGTCQVSTTLYSAVLYADLQIVSRSNHALTVGYVPLGQDATVAYGSVDFKFKNSTDAPIKIYTSADGSTITVSIIGSEWQPPRNVELKHVTSYTDGGTLVTSTRYVYENGELVSTDPLGESFYKPHEG